MTLPRLLFLGLLVLSPSLVHAQATPPPAPSCDEQLAETKMQLAIVRQIREQYEGQIAHLATQAQALADKVRALEAATAKAPPADPKKK